MRKNVIMDSQILNSIQICGYKTDLVFNKNLQPPIKATPLEEGDLLHVMLEHYYKTIIKKGVQVLYNEFEELVKDSIKVGEKHALKLNISPSECSEVIFQFQKYVEFYRMDGWKPLEVEKPFIVEIYKDEELGIYYTGKIDLIVEVPYYGLCVVDHKKADRNKEPLSLSNQFSGYSFATGLTTVIVNKIGFQKTLPVEDRMRRYPLSYLGNKLERWREDTIFWGRTYAFYLETGTWPRNRTSCDDWGGCIFGSVCGAETDEASEHLLTKYFVVGEKWDVTKNMKEKINERSNDSNNLLSSDNVADSNSSEANSKELEDEKAVQPSVIPKPGPVDDPIPDSYTTVRIGGRDVRIPKKNDSLTKGNNTKKKIK